MYRFLKVILILFVITAKTVNAEDSIIKKYPDGSIYTGPLKKGLHHGLGTYSLPNGYEYTGAWVDGQIQGQGVATYPDGTTYTCLLYTSPSPRDVEESRMPSSA